MKFKMLKLAASCLGAMVAPANAAVISGFVNGGTVNGLGTFVQLTTGGAGFSVGQDNFNTNNLYAFDEKQNFTLTSALATNLGITNIAVGTKINSHFVFFDPRARQTVQGNVTFNTPVLAAITQRPQLIASNYLGAANITYLTPPAYGLEPGIDFVTLASPGANSIRLNFLSTDSPGDHFRVITAAPISAVPEPAAWTLMILGFGFVGQTLRRRTKKAELLA